MATRETTCGCMCAAPVLLLLLLLAGTPDGVAAAAAKRGGTRYCGVRSFGLAMMGTWEVAVTAVYKKSTGALTFRVDRDMHVAWCKGTVVDGTTGAIAKVAPCLQEVIDKYSLTDVTVTHQKASPAFGKSNALVVSATARPMGFSLGKSEIILTPEACSGGRSDKSDL